MLILYKILNLQMRNRKTNYNINKQQIEVLKIQIRSLQVQVHRIVVVRIDHQEIKEIQ